MLAESTKQDLREITELLKGMDSIGMMIITSNATALLARQRLAEKRARHLEQCEQSLQVQIKEPELVAEKGKEVNG